MVSRSAGVRSVVLVRHGISEMNVAMPAWGSPGFADPEIRDAPLTAEGLAGARALREAAARDFGDVELVKQVRGLVRDLKQWSAPKGHSPGAPLFDIEEGQAGASDGEGWSPRARPAITEEADEEPSRYV